MVNKQDFPVKMADLSRTAAALKKWDEQLPLLTETADRALEEDNWKALEAADHEMTRLELDVSQAFAEDTKAFNDPETVVACCRPGPVIPSPGAELSFIRRMVKLRKEAGPDKGRAD